MQSPSPSAKPLPLKTHRRRLPPALVGWLGLLVSGTAFAADATYVNARFGYSISYPADLLVAEPESDNGDGRAFHARRGTARMLVWASNNVLAESPAALARQAERECAGQSASYRLVKPAVAAVSCTTSRGDVFYEKTLIRGDVLTSILVTYPAQEKAAWDAVVARISKSMVPARGG